MKTGVFGIAFVEGVHIASLEEFHDYLLGTASSIVASGKELASPMLFVLSNGGKLAIIPAASSSMQGIANYQQAVVREPMVRACAMVFEAWLSSHPIGTDRKNVPMPRDDPARTEAVGVSIMTAGRQAMTFSPIKRPENTVEKAAFEWLDKTKNLTKASGRIVR
jgi:hypothetical protein